MSTAPANRGLVIAVSPCGTVEPSPRIVTAANNGGGLGVLDLGSGNHWALRALSLAATWSAEPIGVRVPAGCAATLDDVAHAGRGGVDLVVLPADSPWRVSDVTPHHRVLVEVTSRAEAHEAAAAGAHGLIARGMEAGGRVSELSSFVLLQHLVADEQLRLPVWVAGGVGERTAAACVAGGAAGVVLDSQLALMPESDLPDDVMATIRRMDGSETVLVGQSRGVRRGGRTVGAAATDDGAELLPIGQDGWLAAVFAQRWGGTAAAVREIRATLVEAARDDAAAEILVPGSPLAASLGVRVPVAQGPMTRVSDQAGFAAAVGAAGALPFIALALSNPEQSRRMLRDAAAAMPDRPWGVGVLGFAPEALREAQIQAILEVKPACAIIAGGRPAQAKLLEEAGIRSFLHVPSPTLLRQFLRAGARKFVFEGAECGGHVGPRASFPLWEAQLLAIEEYLADQPADVATEVQVFFAGGVHDARSAAMVAAMAAPLARRGAGVGVLMGTAYLFTREAVEHGAIQPLFQRQVFAAERTALLETAPGHATRCVDSQFVTDFVELRTELEAQGVDSREIWERLELLNVGRLRIASKGLRRDGDALVSVDEAGQAAEGLFMAGQVVVLRDRVTTVATLHDEVSTGARDYHAARLAALRDELGLVPATAVEPTPEPLDIAVVGMSTIFPNSPDLAAYWQTILSATDTVTEVPAERWDTSIYYTPDVPPGQAGRLSVSKWGGFISPVPIDPIKFGIPPAALASIDPAQLLALEAAHRALADAGYAYDAPGADHARTGVVFGAEAGSDLASAGSLRGLLPAYVGDLPAELEEQLPVITEDSFPGMLSNVIAGRIANRLDLGGSNYTVDAACAASLAAVDVACKELASGSADLMVCGGVDLHNGINDFLLFTSVHALSPTGRCRTFDSTADGIALGEGVACVILKRLADAERDGDRIYAVIKGVGGASDGRALGLTAPRPEGQRRALERAYEGSGLSPREVGLVEAHGTGTVVGDRTELETLTKLFTEEGAEPGSCTLGSVKSQIGHTKCAAGLAGMIKAAMAIYTGVKPPTINLTRPNPAWSAEKSPFAFHTSATPWNVPVAERVAGVSAFGFGGANFHVVLAGYAGTPEPRHTADAWPAELFCFRGTDRPAAHRAVQKLATTLAGGGDPARPWRLRDLAATAARESDSRSGPVQVAIVARDLDELATLLRRALAGEHDPGSGLIQPTPPTSWTDEGKVAFLFPGQGSQRPGALADLFVAFPEVRHYLDSRWSELLFPPAAFDPEREKELEDRVRDTRVAQPVLGIGGLAVDHLLRRLGVRPDMAGGHSYGELVALCTAGAFDAETLLELSRERAESILAAAGDDPGTMAAVSGTPDAVGAVLAEAGLTGEVVLANHNAPSQIVISGPTPAIDKAITALKAAKLSARRLSVACAFHSPVVAAGGERFAGVLAGKAISAPRIPVWSNRTASRYGADVRGELAAQIGSPVRFVDQVEAMYADGARVFVEVGPGEVLSKLVRSVLADRPHLAVACDGRPGQGLRGFLLAIAQLACAGVPVRTGWLFHGRNTVDVSSVKPEKRPTWTVDGFVVRDRNGAYLPGGMKPARRIKELSMTQSTPATSGAWDNRDALLSEFLRTSRDMIASQRDVMLAYFGEGAGGRLVWQPNEGYQPASLPAASAAVATIPAPAPATVEVATVADAAPAVPGAPTAMDFQTAILDVISERTGYPLDLIELDLDLEADLSIDSIKRAEVAGEVAMRLSLSTEGDESELEDLVKARTVRSMVEWLTNRAAAELASRAGEAAPALAGSTATATVTTTVTVATATAAAPADAPAPVRAGIAPTRLVARPTPLPAADAQPATVLAGTALLVSGDNPVAEEVAALLRGHGATVHRSTGESVSGANRVDGAIYLDAMAEADTPMLPAAFPAIQQALKADPRWLLAAAPTGAGAGARADGLRGLFRTISREYPKTAARLVEVDGAAPAGQVARSIVDELLTDDRAPVVAHGPDGRLAPTPKAVALGALADTGAGPAGDGVAEARALGLDGDSVVVLVGGARGITATFGRALATASRCRIALVGRTPMPEGPEDPELAAAVDKPALRAALARRGVRSPAEIERTAQQIMAGREVNATLAELTELGSQVSYHQVDVRDQEAVHQLLKEVHGERGRLDGVVYAAGVIEDRLLAEKDPQSFARVFTTKVDGAAAMLDALDDLACAPKFVVLFGSIAAVYGNRGQSDYSAANDALESMGARWTERTGNRCLTVHWGPWAPTGDHGGMVSPELQKEYAKRGIDMIDPEEGAMSLLRELAWGDPAAAAVIYTASAW